MSAIKDVPSPRLINPALTAPHRKAGALDDEAGADLSKHTAVALFWLGYHGPQTSCGMGTLQ